MSTDARRTLRSHIAGSAALSVAVVSFETFRHHAPLRASHLAFDAALAFPVAVVAIMVASALAPARTLRRALFGTAVLTAALVPSVLVHAWLHATPGMAHGARHGMRDALAAAPLLLGMMLAGFRVRAEAARLRTGAMLATAVLGVVGVLPARGAPLITPFAVPLPIPPVLTDADITLTAAQTDVPIVPGAPTSMWTYNGTFPGPTIRRPSGAQTRVTVVNDLPAEAGALTLHHHGEHARSADDGQPASYLIRTGAQHTYTYDVMEGGAPERGAFQWYHDHAMDVTGRNVWKGLAGMAILDDPAEAEINAALPHDERDVPLMIVDRTFDANNQIPYTHSDEGVTGTAVLVNGAPQPYFDVADVRYRLRLLNASNMRSYTFSLSDGRDMTQIATESGLLDVPVAQPSITLGPAERAEVIVDFSGELGQNVVLKNSIGYGPNLESAMQFRVVRDEEDSSTMPQLRTTPFYDPVEPATTRVWNFDRDQVSDGAWIINGQRYDPNRVDATPKLGTVERWVFVNTSDHDHIVHIHDVDWRIESRVWLLDPSKKVATVGEPGLRESFRLDPYESVSVVTRFTDHTGVYVLHCHMLEHEDHAMMAQFQVVT